ncbi:hypothetical protein K1719_037998 [Acacia pycnantha]|nr:hypothetical protein K1719_037998 [Acacia pycnantha]
MQHVRRPPRYKANIQEPKFGSRFSVLREEVGMEGNGVEVEVNSEIPGPTVVLEHLPRVKVPSQQDSLCSMVLRGKYGRDRDLKRECKMVKSDSELWRSLGPIWPEVVGNLVWEVGDGAMINFWDDHWVDVGIRLAGKCVGVDPAEERYNKVRDMVNDEGNWNF